MLKRIILSAVITAFSSAAFSATILLGSEATPLDIPVASKPQALQPYKGFKLGMSISDVNLSGFSKVDLQAKQYKLFEKSAENKNALTFVLFKNEKLIYLSDYSLSKNIDVSVSDFSKDIKSLNGYFEKVEKFNILTDSAKDVTFSDVVISDALNKTNKVFIKSQLNDRNKSLVKLVILSSGENPSVQEVGYPYTSNIPSSFLMIYSLRSGSPHQNYKGPSVAQKSLTGWEFVNKNISNFCGTIEEVASKASQFEKLMKNNPQFKVSKIFPYAGKFQTGVSWNDPSGQYDLLQSVSKSETGKMCITYKTP